LRRTSAWFYAHRDDLEVAGFPKPVPVVGRYNIAAVQAWLDRTGGAPVDSPANDDPIMADREALDRRFGHAG
jgi:hypothetical protein